MRESRCRTQARSVCFSTISAWEKLSLVHHFGASHERRRFPLPACAALLLRGGIQRYWNYAAYVLDSPLCSSWAHSIELLKGVIKVVWAPFRLPHVLSGDRGRCTHAQCRTPLSSIPRCSIPSLSTALVFCHSATCDILTFKNLLSGGRYERNRPRHRRRDKLFPEGSD